MNSNKNNKKQEQLTYNFGETQEEQFREETKKIDNLTRPRTK